MAGVSTAEISQSGVDPKEFYVNVARGRDAAYAYLGEHLMELRALCREAANLKIRNKAQTIDMLQKIIDQLFETVEVNDIIPQQHERDYGTSNL